jgi:hypothetical protein
MTAQEALPVKEYFAQNPVVRTRDLDEARHITSAKLCDHKLEVNEPPRPVCSSATTRCAGAPLPPITCAMAPT